MLAVFLLVLLIAGCVTGPKPQLMVEPGKGVETLQSPVAITITAGGTSRSVRGFLIFKRPDRFHMAVLGPFGITLLEVYSEGDRLTCLIPSKDLACSGLLAELPEGGGLKSWQIMKWVVEEGPVDAIFHAPRHPYTRALLRSIPSIQATPRTKLPTIAGSIPHPYNRPPGCPFHPRCPDFMPGTCDGAEPALEAVADGHLASCFLYQPAGRA